MSTQGLTALSWGLLIVLYAIRLVCGAQGGAAEEFWGRWFRRETGLLDPSEAILWVFATVLYARITWTMWKRHGVSLATAWFLGMTLVCFVLCGEEVSWGQHVFGVKPSAQLAEINAQHELNFHNLNISMLLGIPPDSPWYPKFKNFNYLLNPAYYLFSCLVWVGLPWVQRRGWWSALATIPTPDPRIVRLFVASVLAYLVVDKLLVWDVGEIFEFNLVSVYALAAFDIRRRVAAAPAITVTSGRPEATTAAA